MVPVRRMVNNVILAGQEKNGKGRRANLRIEVSTFRDNKLILYIRILARCCGFMGVSIIINKVLIKVTLNKVIAYP